jgi:hypothetical protein
VATDDPKVKAAEREVRAAHRAVREARHKHLTGRALPSDEPPLCSFCGAGQNTVRRMLVGDGGAHICSECVEAFYVGDKEGK